MHFKKLIEVHLDCLHELQILMCYQGPVICQETQMENLDFC